MLDKRYLHIKHRRNTFIYSSQRLFLAMLGSTDVVHVLKVAFDSSGKDKKELPMWRPKLFSILQILVSLEVPLCLQGYHGKGYKARCILKYKMFSLDVAIAEMAPSHRARQSVHPDSCWDASHMPFRTVKSAANKIGPLHSSRNSHTL